MPPLSLDELLSFAGARTMMGQVTTVFCIDRATALKCRRMIKRLMLPPPARKLLKIKQWPPAKKTMMEFEHGICVQ